MSFLWLESFEQRAQKCLGFLFLLILTLKFCLIHQNTWLAFVCLILPGHFLEWSLCQPPRKLPIVSIIVWPSSYPCPAHSLRIVSTNKQSIFFIFIDSWVSIAGYTHFLFYKQVHFWLELSTGFLIFSLKVAYKLLYIILTKSCFW